MRSLSPILFMKPCLLASVFASTAVVADPHTSQPVQVQGTIRPQPVDVQLNTNRVSSAAVFLNALQGTGELDSVEQVEINAITMNVQCDLGTRYDLRLVGDAPPAAHATLFNGTDFSEFGDLAPWLGDGAFAFPLSNISVQPHEPGAAWVHFIASPLGKEVQQREQEGLEPIAYRSATESFGLFNSQSVNPLFQGRSMVTECGAGQVDDYHITAIWVLDGQRLDNRQLNTLQGSITLQLSY